MPWFWYARLYYRAAAKKETKDTVEPVEKAETNEAEPVADEPEEEENTVPPEQMDLIKYNYYVDLNNELVDVFVD